MDDSDGMIYTEVKLLLKLGELRGMRKRMIKFEGEFTPLYVFSCWEVACIYEPSWGRRRPMVTMGASTHNTPLPHDFN